MKSWFVPGLIILGVVLILAALLIPSREVLTLTKKTLATVNEFNGSVTVQGLDQTDTALVQKKTKVKNLDLITTREQATTTITLNTINAEVRILENSMVLFEENTDGTILLTIKNGDLVVDNFGTKDSLFWIRKEGRQLSAIDYSLSNESSSEKNNPARAQVLAQSKNTETLSQVKIEEILSNKKNDFFRCYGQLIQKEEQAHGQLLLSFEILPTGKVLSVNFAKTDLKQPYFLSCLKEVVMRTTFPVFSGAPITTVFPLKFE